MAIAQMVKVFGPNLSHAGQQKGHFHVHDAECGDCRHYGPGTKYGGDTAHDEFEGFSHTGIALYCYPPDEFDYDPDTEVNGYLADFYFAPCVKLPLHPPATYPTL